MNWDTIIVAIAGLLGGGYFGRIIFPRRERAESREIEAKAIQTSINSLSALVVSLSEQLDSCTKEKSQLQQKIMNEGMEAMRLREQLKILTDASDRMEKHIEELEHTIQSLKNITPP